MIGAAFGLGFMIGPFIEHLSIQQQVLEVFSTQFLDEISLSITLYIF